MVGLRRSNTETRTTMWSSADLKQYLESFQHQGLRPGDDPSTVIAHTAKVEMAKHILSHMGDDMFY